MKTAFQVLLILCSFQAMSQQVSRGPYLQVLTPESIQICWSTDIPCNSKVIFGNSLGGQNLSVSDTVLKTDHFINLNGLSSATFYYYSIGTITNVLAGNTDSYRFKTAPANGTVSPYRIWALGDFGKANQGQRDVLSSFLNYTNGEHTDFMIFLGDNAYSDGTQQEYQDKCFNIYDSIMPFLPVFSTPGNHDYNSVNRFDPPAQHSGPYYDIFNNPMNAEAGGVASNTELYYSYDFGNIHFISLNSEIQAWTASSTSQMFNWLQQDLQSNTKEWVICYFHQPPYSKGSHDSDDFWELLMLAMRQNALPILEQYGVDLVLCGHSHVYERSKLIKGHYGYSFTYSNATHAISTASGNYNQGQQYTKYINGTNEGTVYAVCGNSGSSESGASMNHPIMIANDGGSDDFGSLLIEVNGNRLDCKYLKSTGVIYDEFTIVKPDGSSPITSVDNNSDRILNPRVYPNPAGDFLQVEYALNKEAELKITLLDYSGKELFSEKMQSYTGENRKLFNVNGLTAGNYILNIRTENETVSLPFSHK
jgi:predicted MPP superfamily phosphohydrolase